MARPGNRTQDRSLSAVEHAHHLTNTGVTREVENARNYQSNEARVHCPGGRGVHDAQPREHLAHDGPAQPHGAQDPHHQPALRAVARDAGRARQDEDGREARAGTPAVLRPRVGDTHFHDISATWLRLRTYLRLT